MGPPGPPSGARNVVSALPGGCREGGPNACAPLSRVLYCTRLKDCFSRVGEAANWRDPAGCVEQVKKTAMDAEKTNASLEQILGVLRRRGLLIGLCCLLAAGAAFGFSRIQTTKYTATASLIFNTNQQSVVTGLPASAANGLQTEQNTNLQLTKLEAVAERTAAALGGGLTKGAVQADVSVNAHGESDLVDVSATATSPALAAKIANTYAAQFVLAQQNASREYYESALAVINKQLAQGGSIALQERATALQLLAQLPADVRVAQTASIPTSPSSPNASRNTLLGGFLGLLLGVGLAFLVERSDRRIQEPRDLEEIYGLPLLGTVPESDALAEPAGASGSAGLPPAEAEVFNLIRAHLRTFSADRQLHSILVGSATPNDGKTTIASQLAAAAAGMGSRVLLIEADLRHPTMAARLGTGPAPGLVGVLTGACSMGEATRSIKLVGPAGGIAKHRSLDVLLAGQPLPLNPPELIESHAMDAVLELARSAYDLVVIDTPPLIAVSDAFPLLRKVDGVIIVGWMGRTPWEVSEQLHQTLAKSGAPLLGVIANGVLRTGTAGAYGPHSYISSEAPAAVTSLDASPAEEPTPTS